MTATRRSMARAGVLAASAMLLAGLGSPVFAAAPANDSSATPTIVGAVPYTDGPVSTLEATTAPTDPAFCFDPESGPDRATVWYRFTPAASSRYLVDTFDSSYDTTLYVGTPNGTGGIDVIGCVDDAANSLQSAVGWDGVAGTTYLIMVGTCCGGGGSGGGGTLVVHLDTAPPPPTIDVTVSGTGSFTRYGVATIGGTVTCTNAGGVFNLDAFLVEPVGRREISGSVFGESLPCSATSTTWSVEIPGDTGKFLGGKATADLFVQACGPKECTSDGETVDVRLRH